MKHTPIAVWMLVCLLSLQGAAKAASSDGEDIPDLNPHLTETPAVTDTNAPPAALTNQLSPEAMIQAEKAWRSFLHIQGQLEHALLAIELNRRENQASAQNNQNQINEGLSNIEQVLQAQQEREVEALRESNRNMLIVAGAFAGVGFLAMFLTSFFHFRSMNRLAGIASGLPMAAGYGPALLQMEEDRLLDSSAQGGRRTGQRLLSVIERLEQRVHELEHTSQVSMDHDPTLGSVADDNAFGTPGQGNSLQNEELSTLLGKGQALLNLGKAEEALLCFDHAVSEYPDQAECYVKRGSALEKLNRLDEAIACYDQAIETNESMTLAYLYKAGLFNRMERYDEALACYEKALKTQQTTAPVTS